ncbi:hypothetical protein P691DRAFT_768706 [Macrolepiota fuliginosa MF-IS2]|uniref:Uncharacterized protein n=1 Tax=Macrolepiota fuliginosa MF-IS2 TaxID=1400762 RepID=A0A9P6BVJ9_9AGAR|nr:hypothetical protein P691DRAFT_768706 [Macrolepiota fuliginosa MF-IS2]
MTSIQTRPLQKDRVLNKDTLNVMEVDDERTGGERNTTMDGGDPGPLDTCSRIVLLIRLAKEVLFNDAYQLSSLDAFPSSEFLLLSHFHGRILSFLYATSKFESLDQPMAFRLYKYSIASPRFSNCRITSMSSRG